MRRILGGLSAIGLGIGLTLSVAGLAAGQAEPDTTPARATAPSAPPVPLAQFVSGENLVALVEFNGLDSQGDAWHNTAAYKVLNSTTTGQMLESLLSQILDQTGKNAASPSLLTGAERVTIIEHALRNGFVFALQGKQGTADAADGHAVFVLRNAAAKDARPVFGKLLGQLMGSKSKPTSQVKGTRKTVLVTPEGGKPWAWWAEKDDLVIAPSAGDVDVILAALEGKVKSAVDHPQRKELAAPEGDFQPIGLAFADPKALPPLPAEPANALRTAGLDKVERVDFRWGIENTALMSVLRIQSPPPRQGLLTIADQPTFNTTNLPLIPASALSFTAFSLNPTILLDALKAASASNPALADALQAAEARVQEETRKRLREDVLEQLGPRMVLFTTAEKATAGRGGPLAALAGMGLQVPRGAIAIELKDPAEFSRTLDELIVFANREFADRLPALSPMFAPPAPRADDPNRPGAARQKSTAPNPNVPRFQLLSAQDPKLYLLRLPTAIGALTNLNLTVALGKKHLVIGTAADLARETLALEDKTEGRWVPAGDLAQTFTRLPQGLTMLQVSDNSATLPESLANLPTTIAGLSTMMAAAASGRTPPGLPGMPMPGAPGMPAPPPAAPGGGSGLAVDGGAASFGSSGASSSSGDSALAPAPGDPIDQGSGAPIDQGSGAPGAPGAGGGGGGDAVAGPIAFTLDPALAPKAEEIRALLFPGSAALSVNGAEIRYETRTAFPNIVSGSSGMSAALLMPAIQAARDAARRTQQQQQGAGAEGAAPASPSPEGLNANP